MLAPPSSPSLPAYHGAPPIQKPYLPLGSLRAQMLYPRSEDEALSTPATLEGFLEQVQLGYLCSRFGGLGATRDWQDELSLGEQQVCLRRRDVIEAGRAGSVFVVLFLKNRPYEEKRFTLLPRW